MTCLNVEDALKLAELNRLRIRVHYGDIETGQDWGDLYDVAGQIGRSVGPNRIRLLLANSRAIGGGAILESCIVRVRFANRKDGGDLYRHPAYTPPPRFNFPQPEVWERNFA